METHRDDQSIYSFMSQLHTECLLCARHSSNHLEAAIVTFGFLFKDLLATQQDSSNQEDRQ